MAALGFILIGFLLGYVVCSLFIPDSFTANLKSFKGKEIKLSSLFYLLPLWYIVGNLLLTWFVYITACFFSDKSNPLFYANIIALSFSFAIIVFGLIIYVRKHRLALKDNIRKISINETVVLILVVAVTAFLMYLTFHIRDGKLYTGLSVFSDFTPHLSMMRSFSSLNNFPTQYTVVAGADVKYHFMFEFLCGNLEYLGLPIDLAFNIPSTLSLVSMFSLLYVFAVRVTGRKFAGGLAVLLTAFRSSFTVFTYLASFDSYSDMFSAVVNNSDFVGTTLNEEWGLWNLNVYLNQRHFAFGISIMLIILILFAPCLYDMAMRLKDRLSLRAYFKESLFAKEGYVVKDIKMPVFAGLILGGLAFFNGAVLIATVIVLFFMAVVSDRRLEFLITAALAGALSLAQSNAFVTGSVVSAKLQLGFLSDTSTIFGILRYLFLLLGILLIVIVFAFIFSDFPGKMMIFSAAMLVVFAFTVSLTPDIAVNHKYIMIAVMLFNVFAAKLLTDMLDTAKKGLRVIAVVLIVCLVATGLFDFGTIIRRNEEQRAVVTEVDNDIIRFVKDNCTSEDLFLTSNYFLNGDVGSYMILSGASMYLAWDYFGWSAGYDTEYRSSVAATIYSAQTPEILKSLINATDIDYIVVDGSMYYNDSYPLNEDLISSVYPVAFTMGEGYDRFTIYKTGDVR